MPIYGTYAASGGECDPERFKSPGQAQRFLSAHDQINNLFHLRRDHLPAAQYRAGPDPSLSDLGRGHRRGCSGIGVSVPGLIAGIVAATLQQVDGAAVARAMLADPTSPVAAIAKRLGVSRTTFYAYFPAARTRAQALHTKQ